VSIQQLSRENRSTNCREVEEAVRRLFIGISSLTSAALAAASLGSSPVFEDPNVWPVPCLGGCEGAGRDCEVDDGIGAEVRCGAEPRTRPGLAKLSPDSLLPKQPMAGCEYGSGGKDGCEGVEVSPLKVSWNSGSQQLSRGNRMEICGNSSTLIMRGSDVGC
jgi:hypothetical protein